MSRLDSRVSLEIHDVAERVVGWRLRFGVFLVKRAIDLLYAAAWMTRAILAEASVFDAERHPERIVVPGRYRTNNGP